MSAFPVVDEQGTIVGRIRQDGTFNGWMSEWALSFLRRHFRGLLSMWQARGLNGEEITYVQLPRGDLIRRVVVPYRVPERDWWDWIEAGCGWDGVNEPEQAEPEEL